MKKRFLGYLLGSLFILQSGSLLNSSPITSSGRLAIEQVRKLFNVTQKALNKKTVVYYLLYFYPSLVHLVGSLTLDNYEDLQTLEDAVCLVSIPNIF